MITKSNEPIMRQSDGNYIIMINGYRYGVCDNNPSERYTIDMVDAYVAEHPEALVPEPAPPEPTAEQIEAARVAGIRAKLDDLDRKAVRPLRAIAAGTATESDRTMLAEIETQAAELRASIGATA